MNEVPESFRENNEDKITILSPVEIEGEQYTDHEKLFEIIKEEAEKGGLGWKYDLKQVEVGAVEKELPEESAIAHEKVLVDLLIKYRRKGYKLTFHDMVERLRSIKTPKTPVWGGSQ